MEPSNRSLELSDVYQNQEQQNQAAKVRELLHQASNTLDKELGDSLRDQADIISLRLANWLRKTYPDNFRVFEIEPADEYDRSPFYSQTSEGFKNVATSPGQRREEFYQLKDKLKLKQDDIVIFHTGSKSGRGDTVLWMTTDNSASARRLRYGLPARMEPVLEWLGLTRRAAQKLYFPDNEYPLFSSEMSKERLD